MPYTVLNLKSELSSMLHGTDLSKVNGVFAAINRAARETLSLVDYFETKRLAEIANPIFDSVYNYPVPTDLKMNKIIDIRPQANRTPKDNILQTNSKSFDLRKPINYTTVEYVNGVKTLRLNLPFQTPVTLSQLDSLTDNGTWAATASASDLAVDPIYYVSSYASLKFNLAAAGSSGYIENSTLESVDLSEHEGISSLFLYVYLPSPSAVTGITLRWGSSSANYWSKTSTSPFDQTSFVTGWNLVRFDWSTATETGTADSSDITYARITVAYDGTAMTAVRVDNLVSILGTIQEIQYYSNYIFQNGTTGALQEECTTNEDIIILEPVSRNGLLFKTGEFVAQQIQEQGGSVDISYFSSRFDNWLLEYRGNYKSECLKPQTQYYRMPGTVNSRAVRIRS